MIRKELVRQIARAAMTAPLYNDTTATVDGVEWDLRGDIVTDMGSNVITAFVVSCTKVVDGSDVDELNKKEINLLNELLNGDDI